MPSALLIRDDTLAELVLDGVISVDRDRDGSLTRNPVVDRSYVRDGLTVGPTTITIRALISQSPPTEGALTGPARIAQVLTWLEEARRAGVTVSFQQPGRDLDVDYAIERYADSHGERDAPELTIVLGEVRFAQTSSVEIAEVRRSARVPSETAKDGEGETDGGRRGGDPSVLLRIFQAGGLVE